MNIRFLAVITAVLCFVQSAFAQVPADPFNVTRATAFTYDAVTGMVTSQSSEPDHPQLCVKTEYQYDTYGNQSHMVVKNCDGATGAALFVEKVSTASHAARASNIAGQFPTSATINGFTSYGEYSNVHASPLNATDANGLVRQWQYDSFGRKLLQIDADGDRIAWSYQYCSSALGSPSTSCTTNTPHLLVGVITTTHLDANGVQNGPTSKQYVDALGRVVREERQRAFDGQWIYTETWFNTLGRVEKTSAATLIGNAPQYFSYATYDALGRNVRSEHDDSTASGGRAVTTTSYQGRTTVITNPLGQTERREVNAVGQLVRVTDNQGNQVVNQFDALGHAIKTVDALGNTKNVTYNLVGLKVAMTDPAMGSWSYAYDAIGRMKSGTDAKGQTTTYQYDSIGRLVKRTEPDLVSNWVYDTYADGSACNKGIGKLCEVYADNGYRRKEIFDNMGRVTSSTHTVDQTYTLNAAYDAQGRMTSRTWPSGVSVNYGYSALGEPTSITLASTGQVLWQPLEFNVHGQVTRYKFGNNVETVNQYSADTTRLMSMAAGPNGSVLNQQYQYDVINNLTSRVDNTASTTESFIYDSLNRLDTHSVSSPWVSRSNAFTYNALGNILTQTEVGAYQYNASGANSVRPHAVSKVTGWSGMYLNPRFTYDAQGNLTRVDSDNGLWRDHVWTSFDMPQSLASNNASAAFVYDVNHGRVKEVFARNVEGVTKTRTVYALHPDQAGTLSYEKEIKEDGSIEHKHYVNGALVLTSTGTAPATVSQIRYWHKDHLGSIAAITNEAGVTVERMAYDPFGKRRHASGQFDSTGQLKAGSTDRGYTGHEHLDELGFVHMNGRVYDPALAKFLSPDPAVQAPDKLQSHNRYAYVWNNPMNKTDPTGFYARDDVTRMDAAVDKAFPVIVAVAATIIGNGAGQAAYIGVFGATAAQSAGAVAAGVVAGGFAGGFAGSFVSSEGDVLAALQGGVMGAAMSGAGLGMGNSWQAQAVMGCVGAAASGGNCGQGALKSLIVSGVAGDNQVARTVVGAVVDSRMGYDPTGGLVAGALGYATGRGSEPIDIDPVEVNAAGRRRVGVNAKPGPVKESWTDVKATANDERPVGAYSAWGLNFKTIGAGVAGLGLLVAALCVPCDAAVAGAILTGATATGAAISRVPGRLQVMYGSSVGRNSVSEGFSVGWSNQTSNLWDAPGTLINGPSLTGGKQPVGFTLRGYVQLAGIREDAWVNRDGWQIMTRVELKQGKSKVPFLQKGPFKLAIPQIELHPATKIFIGLNFRHGMPKGSGAGGD